jgi:hypothetical protein
MGGLSDRGWTLCVCVRAASDTLLRALFSEFVLPFEFVLLLESPLVLVFTFMLALGFSLSQWCILN